MREPSLEHRLPVRPEILQGREGDMTRWAVHAHNTHTYTRTCGRKTRRPSERLSHTHLTHTHTHTHTHNTHTQDANTV